MFIEYYTDKNLYAVLSTSWCMLYQINKITTIIFSVYLKTYMRRDELMKDVYVQRDKLMNDVYTEKTWSNKISYYNNKKNEEFLYNNEYTRNKRCTSTAHFLS